MVGRARQPRLAVTDHEKWHASCVVVNGRAVLIMGASGSGKSGLALQLLALGAQLVADDRTSVWRDNDTIWVDAPDQLSGLIEAREVGILRVAPAGAHKLALIVDMDACETDRLPAIKKRDISGLQIPILRKSKLPHFPAAIMTYLRGQREA